LLSSFDGFRLDIQREDEVASMQNMPKHLFVSNFRLGKMATVPLTLLVKKVGQTSGHAWQDLRTAPPVFAAARDSRCIPGRSLRF
jgi:hypothetical protein